MCSGECITLSQRVENAYLLTKENVFNWLNGEREVDTVFCPLTSSCSLL